MAKIFSFRCKKCDVGNTGDFLGYIKTDGKKYSLYKCKKCKGQQRDEYREGYGYL